MCVQQTAEKKLPTEQDILKSNKGGMGNKVGVITNRITAMMEVQARYQKGTKEWKVLQMRIDSGEKYQQDEIDALKGIVAKPMPTYWYNLSAAVKKDEEDHTPGFQRSLCVYKKPYFMIYVYEDYRQKYRDYIIRVSDLCEKKFHCTLDELKKKKRLLASEKKFLEFVKQGNPFGDGECAMNKICWHIENEFKNQRIELKSNSDFDYKKLKYDVIQNSLNKEQLKNLMDEYVVQVRNYKQSGKVDFLDIEQKIMDRTQLYQYYKDKSKEICDNDKMRHDIILDLCYGANGNKQFCWDCIGDSIVKRLEEMNSGTV